ncbi:biliverdin-producing heme oxygenase [Hansschlegelia plantiphila]|uniref:Heme oxygenase n=1 Tax=Hansschlegelia plantiphila TaxID=374655 RepID=A0A9W6J4I0_9HYPH|nr:biliverdin-producing heme oxygenase [Hansschlegelia plantiphila]GLK69065.1 heme oxygenase [Hansschlegelia plantiphila]
MTLLVSDISPTVVEPSRSRRLRALTSSSHERLDAAIMAGRPFADRERYGRFLDVQHGFHRDIDALYGSAPLAAILPDLVGRRRLGLIERDLADLARAAPKSDAPPSLGPDADLPTALGWLYVAEGSNLGAAFLLKEAAKLGLFEAFGARHLAGAPEGRGLHWRTFTVALDAIDLDESGEALVEASAQSAFARVQALVDAAFR